MSQGTTPNAYRYTGQQSDADSGLLYLRARYYEPSTGRFITQDAKKGDPKNPKTFNFYVYCLNNPLTLTDPTGYASIRIFITPKVANYSSAAIDALKNKGENDVQVTVLTDNYYLNAQIVYNALKSSDYIIVRAHGSSNSLGYCFSFEGEKGDTAHTPDGNPYLTPNDFTEQLSKIFGDSKTKLLFLDACGSAEINNDRFFTALRNKKIRCCGSLIHQLPSNTPLEIIHAIIDTPNSDRENIIRNILDKFNELRTTNFILIPKQ
jgi:RHS repeat-associated protein